MAGGVLLRAVSPTRLAAAVRGPSPCAAMRHPSAPLVAQVPRFAANRYRSIARACAGSFGSGQRNQNQGAHGWPGAATPHQVPGSDAVLGVGLRRRPWRRSPCSTSCLTPPARSVRASHPQGHISIMARRFAASLHLRAAMSRSDEPVAPPCTRAGVAPARRGWLAMDGQPRPVTTRTSCQADPEHRRYAGARPVRAGAGVGCPLFGSFLWASRERNPHRSQRSVRSASSHGCGTMSIFGHSATRQNQRAPEFPISMSIKCVAVHTQWKPLVLTASRSGGLQHA